METFLISTIHVDAQPQHVNRLKDLVVPSHNIALHTSYVSAPLRLSQLCLLGTARLPFADPSKHRVTRVLILSTGYVGHVELAISNKVSLCRD